MCGSPCWSRPSVFPQGDLLWTRCLAPICPTDSALIEGWLDPTFPPPPPDPQLPPLPSGSLHLETAFPFSPASMQDIPGADEAVPYDDGITWSWEQEVEPLDIEAYVAQLPLNEWVEIDQLTLRRLFEDVVRKGLEEMGLEPGKGGEFEKLLRQKLLYFVPEYEYWWPPYEEDFSRREVKFPVKIMRTENDYTNIAVKIQLGRYSYDREIEFYMGNKKQLEGFSDFTIVLSQNKYLPGVTGPSARKKRKLYLIY